MSRFTPGPWEADGQHVYAVEFQRHCCGRGYSSCCGDPEISESRFQVAQCAPENANLIAAAPDLLEALREMISPYERLLGVELFEALEAPLATKVQAARAAIARATGEQ